MCYLDNLETSILMLYACRGSMFHPSAGASWFAVRRINYGDGMA